MKKFTFWKRNKLNSDIKSKELLSEIYSTEEFKSIISRERVRYDRSGNFFSLVIVDLNGRSEKAIVQLMEILNNRGTRTIDEVGMLDCQSIGVCLHDTDKTGALSFANTIHERIISATGQNFSYKIYVYPTDWQDINNLNGHLNKSHKNNGYRQQSKPNSSLSYLLSDQTDKDFVDNVRLEKKIKKNCYYKIPIWKRFMDIVVSAFVLVVGSPFFLIIAILIKILSPGPTFFKQERMGYMGKTFIMLKFRSMKVGNCTNAHREYLSGLIRAEKYGDGNLRGPMIKKDNLNSLIPYGNVLRWLCLDEFPQLINVIRGEMSLIGPRPPILYEQEEYQSWHKWRFNALPGITGLWQVSGKNRLSFDQMIRMDIKYSRQISFWLDVKIMLLTPFAILFGAAMNKRKTEMNKVGRYA